MATLTRMSNHSAELESEVELVWLTEKVVSGSISGGVALVERTRAFRLYLMKCLLEEERAAEVTRKAKREGSRWNKLWERLPTRKCDRRAFCVNKWA